MTCRSYTYLGCLHHDRGSSHRMAVLSVLQERRRVFLAVDTLDSWSLFQPFLAYVHALATDHDMRRICGASSCMQHTAAAS